MKKVQVSIYTDGSCRGNPGPGGWAFVVSCEVFYGSLKQIQSGSHRHTTNNEMELVAMLEAVKWADKYANAEVKIHTDSEYVHKGITQARRIKKHREIWARLRSVLDQSKVEMEFIKVPRTNKTIRIADKAAKAASSHYL